MGPLPTLPQNCCFLNYKKIENQDETQSPLITTSNHQNGGDGGSGSSKMTESILTNKQIKQEVLDDDCDDIINYDDELTSIYNDVDNNSDNDSITTTATTTTTTNNKFRKTISTRKRKQLLDQSNHPRKSPREHASTLAILSSRKNGVIINGVGGDLMGSDENSRNSMDSGEETITKCCDDEILVKPTTTTATTSTIDERSTTEETTAPSDGCYVNVMKLSNDIDCFFNEFSYENDVELPPMILDELSLITPSRDRNNLLNGISLVDEHDNYDNLFDINNLDNNNLISKKPLALNRKLTQSECLHLARNARRRKNNRTGWPKKKRVMPQSAGGVSKVKEIVSSTIEEIPLMNPIIHLIPVIPIKAEIPVVQLSSLPPPLPPPPPTIFPISRFDKQHISVDLSACIEKSDEVLFTSRGNRNGLIYNHRVGESTTVTTTTKNSSSRQIDTTVGNENISDMFTVSSSDSLDSALTNITEIKIEKDEFDTMSSQSIFVSDDSSIDNDGEILLPATIKCELNDVDQQQSIDIILSSYGLRSNKKTPEKKGRKSSTNSNPNSLTKKIISPQYSPRKLRKPRGRWYRER